jgi:nitroreductase/NAD-dependent dihydropyrimidine dehydrogenase PreA subunit
MSVELIQIDTATCNQDGICADVCPAGIITARTGEFPGLVEGADELCIRCGHCAAVCPTGSLSHRDMPASQMPPVNPEMRLSAEQCEHFFRSRRSIRAYKEKPPDPDAVARLIEIARYAPTGHNSQCVQWTVLADRKELERLGAVVVEWMRWMIRNMPDVAASIHMEWAVERWENGSDVVFRGAPMLIAAHADQDLRPAPNASVIAMTHLELAAPTLGLGGCWAGYFMAAAANYPPMQEALALPDGHLCFAAMMIGYPRYGYRLLPPRHAPSITWRMP